MEAYSRGHWWMVGLWAEAEVVVTGSVVQRIRSGGLWGIESDSDADYLAGVTEQELSSLHDELLAVGFSQRAIQAVMKYVQEVGP